MVWIVIYCYCPRKDMRVRLNVETINKINEVSNELVIVLTVNNLTRLSIVTENMRCYELFLVVIW